MLKVMRIQLQGLMIPGYTSNINMYQICLLVQSNVANWTIQRSKLQSPAVAAAFGGDGYQFLSIRNRS